MQVSSDHPLMTAQIRLILGAAMFMMMAVSITQCCFRCLSTKAQKHFHDVSDVLLESSMVAGICLFQTKSD